MASETDKLGANTRASLSTCRFIVVVFMSTSMPKGCDKTLPYHTKLVKQTLNKETSWARSPATANHTMASPES